MKERTVEAIMIFVVIGISIIILFPIVQGMIYSSQQSGVESSAHGSIAAVQTLYAEASLKETVELPFTVVFSKDGYGAYNGAEKIKVKNKITNSGTSPTEGQITIEITGKITVKDLKINKFTCNKGTNNEVKCKRNS